MIEKLIKMAYKIYRDRQTKDSSPCPDEETMVCFGEGRLSKEDSAKLQKHLLSCERCAQVLSLYNIKIEKEQIVPEFLIKKTKGLIGKKIPTSLIEITLSVKERLLEIINTTGDIVLDNEIIPLPVLRSRQIKKILEEVTIIKEFQNIRISGRIEKREKGKVKVGISLCDKNTSEPLKDLRIGLFKDDIELESYVIDSGCSSFDNLSFGKYTLKIFRGEEELGVIKLEVI